MPNRDESHSDKFVMRRPVYEQNIPDDSIPLGSRDVLISKNSAERVKSAADFRIRFYPDARLEIIVQHKPNLKHLIEAIVALQPNSAVSLCFVSASPNVDHPLILKSFSSHQTVFIPKCSPMDTGTETDRIVQAVFHLFNWPHFSGSESTSMIVEEEGGKREVQRGVFSMIFDAFVVIVHEFETTRARIKRLEERGGSVITHVGTIQRCDGAAFDSDKLKDILAFLTYLFSFTLGRWSGPQLTVGFDETECRVFESLGMTSQASGPWTPSSSWFDLRHSQFFSELAGPFWRLWSHPYWKQSLPVIINWYLQANKGTQEINVDTAILFSQAAIERLCWSYCVESAKTLTEGQFEPGGMNAANRLKHLFKDLSLSVEIPQTTRNVLPQNLAGLDGMQLITRIRNKLVHPSTAAPLAPDTFYEVWKLSMWYIECAILRIAGYTGKHANRVSQSRVGQVEPMP